MTCYYYVMSKRLLTRHVSTHKLSIIVNFYNTKYIHATVRVQHSVLMRYFNVRSYFNLRYLEEAILWTHMACESSAGLLSYTGGIVYYSPG
jgi:hypothetical protein